MSVIYFIFQQTMLFTIPLMVVALGDVYKRQHRVPARPAPCGISGDLSRRGPGLLACTLHPAGRWRTDNRFYTRGEPYGQLYY